MKNEQEQLDRNIRDNWFAKIGVQKPYTVFVCIMAILILGVFAFSTMQTDLFPNMNLPYAVVAVTPNSQYLTETYGREEFTAYKSGNYEKLVDLAADYMVKNRTLSKDENTLLKSAKTDVSNTLTAAKTSTQSDEDPKANQKAALMGLIAGDQVNPFVKPVAQALLGILTQLDSTVANKGEESALLMLNYLHVPDNAHLDKLATNILARLSSVNGITNSQTRVMTQSGTVMIILEYSGDATVDTADLVVALNSVNLSDEITYGVRYSQPTIVKMDPSRLPIMSVTVSYNGTENLDEMNTWLEKNVLNRVKSAVGVGSVSTTIQQQGDSANQNQAWQGTGDKLTTTFSISINKSSNAVTTEVAANVIAVLDEIKANNAVDGQYTFDYDITSSQAEYISSSLGSVAENLVIGGILAIIILFLFLRSFKMTLAIGISIPLALVATFVFMYFLGINLNIVSMAGLALAVGMLVDNSVVVLENIFRLRSKGLSIKDACIKGASQIMMAMLASSLTTICVFFPMFFLEGMIMEIFLDLVWVVILSLMCSFIVAVMFLPGIVSTFKIEPKKVKVLAAGQKPSWWQRFTAATAHIFDNVLRFCINKKWLTLVLAIVLFFGSACLMLINGFTLMPNTDEGSFSITAPLSKTGQDIVKNNQTETELVQPLYNKIKELLGADLDQCVIEYTDGSSLSAMLSGNNNPALSIEVKLADRHKITTEAAGDKVYEALQTFDEVNYDVKKIAVTSSSMTSSLVDSDVSVIVASDLDDLNDAMTSLHDLGMHLKTEFDKVKTELKIKDTTGFENLGVNQLVKYGNKNAMTFTIEAMSNADTNAIQTKLDALLADYTKEHTDLRVVNTGLQQQMTDAYTSMGTALIVGLLLIYLVMVAIFQSFLMPFIVLICVPLGFTGSFILLAICSMPLSVPALIGFLLLMGVVINNGILAVDYTNQARRDGLSVKEALVAAMHTRMRPIFMTALTTILAMVPMAFGWSFFNVGGSSALMQPLAVVSIGGLLFGTVTTLLVVPAFYALFCHDKKAKDQTAQPAADTVATTPTK